VKEKDGEEVIKIANEEATEANADESSTVVSSDKPETSHQEEAMDTTEEAATEDSSIHAAERLKAGVVHDQLFLEALPSVSSPGLDRCMDYIRYSFIAEQHTAASVSVRQRPQAYRLEESADQQRVHC